MNYHWTKQDKTPTSANIPDNSEELSEQDLNAVSGGSGLRGWKPIYGHGPVVNGPGESIRGL